MEQAGPFWTGNLGGFFPFHIYYPLKKGRASFGKSLSTQRKFYAQKGGKMVEYVTFSSLFQYTLVLLEVAIFIVSIFEHHNKKK